MPRQHFATFAEQFSLGARTPRLGPGLDPQTQMGRLTHALRIEDMERFVDDPLRCALCAYTFTPDLHTAHRLGEELEAGMVGVNHCGVSRPEMPSGGWKESGIGPDMGSAGVLHCAEIKTITVGAPA